METMPEAEEHLAGEGFEHVRFEQPDLHGTSRGKTVPARHFRHYAENGLNFLGGILGLDAQGGVTHLTRRPSPPDSYPQYPVAGLHSLVGATSVPLRCRDIEVGAWLLGGHSEPNG